MGGKIRARWPKIYIYTHVIRENKKYCPPWWLVWRGRKRERERERKREK